MSLRKKIVLGFLLSAFLVLFLAGYLYMNFREIREETAFLEVTDTIRSQSLQLRRHEKNYFLYAPEKGGEESAAIYGYLHELDGILSRTRSPGVERASLLRGLVQEYRRQFGVIEELVKTVSGESERLKNAARDYGKVSRIVEANFLDKPEEDIAYLQTVFRLPSYHPLIASLRRLETEIAGLRKTGEGILIASKELDKTARENVDGFIRSSNAALIIVLPLFLIVGIGTVVVIAGSAVKRLRLLTDVVTRTGEGKFTPVEVISDRWAGRDEIDTLLSRFNTMEEQLEQREQELIRTKKLAAIGTLAAGVAHELNNPLNNIHTTAQRLLKKTGGEAPDYLRTGLDDIFGQTMRVKGIVSDLLEFARGREPLLRTVSLRQVIEEAFRHVAGTVPVDKLRFDLDLRPPELFLEADAEQLERVFINLISNALDAMGGEGVLTITAAENGPTVAICVEDSGSGMSADTLEKLFEPFYSTKDKGTGLGLAIVFSIIRKHKGEIVVASEEGRGTHFSITLPRTGSR